MTQIISKKQGDRTPAVPDYNAVVQSLNSCMTKPPASKTKATVWVVEKGKVRPKLDQLTTEEPLEIRIASPQKTIALTYSPR